MAVTNPFSATSQKEQSISTVDKVEYVLPTPQPLVAQHYEAVTDEERHLDRRINLKTDLCVLTLLSIGFILCGIDKTNLGYVATSTFVKDAHLQPNDIGNALSLFSATYIPFQPVSSVLARRVGPKYWIAALMCTWGVICMCHAFINGTSSLIALRVLLGAAESGFTPVCYYLMSTLYPRYVLGLRMGIFSGMYAIAGAFAGLLAYGLLSITTSSYKGWQIVFLFEGGLTILVGILAIFLLPRRLETAWFLTEAERAHAVARMERDNAAIMSEVDSQGHPTQHSQKISRRDVTDVLKDWKKMLTVTFNILTVLPVTALTTFLPLIVQGMGYSGIKANLMSVPPFVVGTVGLIAIVYSSDKFRERSLHTIFGMFLALIGALVMAVSNDPKLRYGFSNVCLAGCFAGGPLVAVWLAGNTPGTASRSVILGINGWSNIAGVIAGQIFKAQYAPGYRFPLTITMGLTAVGMVGFLSIRVAYMLTNRWRARKIAGWGPEAFEDEARSDLRRGDQKWTFVYKY